MSWCSGLGVIREQTWKYCVRLFPAGHAFMATDQKPSMDNGHSKLPLRPSAVSYATNLVRMDSLIW